MMRRAQILLLLSNLALFGGWIHKFLPPRGGIDTWSDGH